MTYVDVVTGNQNALYLIGFFWAQYGKILGRDFNIGKKLSKSDKVIQQEYYSDNITTYIGG
jgi:hypothetical protein